MKTLHFIVPKDAYANYLKLFNGNERAAINALSINLELTVRRYRSLINNEPNNTDQLVKLSIPIQEYLLPYLNQYCVQKNTTKHQLIVKMLKRKRK